MKMKYHISPDVFKELCRAILSCGDSIDRNIYMTYFHNKDNMTVKDYFKFRDVIIKELKINKVIYSNNLYDKYNKPHIISLKRILNIIE